MVVLQKVYGKAGARDELSTPILAVGAGYMPYLPKKGKYRLSRRLSATPDSVGQPYTEPVSIYKDKESGTFRQGRYKGNYLLYYYYKEEDLGDSDLPPLEVNRMNMRMEGKGSQIVDKALAKTVGSLNEVSDNELIIQQNKLKSVEEQISPFGFGKQKAVDGKGNPVDVDLGDSLHQVSYTRFLADYTHHGIQKGDISGRRKTLSKDFQKAKKLDGADEQYKGMAKAALKYFKGHLRDVNKMFTAMQKTPKTPNQLKSAIPDKGNFNLRQDPRHANVGKRNAMATRVMGRGGAMYMQKGMMDFNRTALSNFPHYSQGVHYTMPLNNPKSGEAPVHGRIGRFQLEQTPKIRWNISALNEAHVHYGLDSTTVDLLNANMGLKRDDINNKRTMAAIFSDIKAAENGKIYGKAYSGEISKKLANGQKVYGTIDVAASTIDMSRIIHEELAPFVREAAMGASKKFTANSLLGPRKPLGKGFWAQPYLSLYDGRAMRYGVGFDL